MQRRLAFAMLLINLAVGLMPQAVPQCLAFPLEACAALSAEPACCETCRNESKPVRSPIQPGGCTCHNVRAMAVPARAARPMLSPSDLAAYYSPVVSPARYPEPSNSSMCLRSGHLPDIPASVLFCTWLK